MSNRRSFTPQVQDSDGQTYSKHFDEESRDYLKITSRENQSEDDSESTDDGFDIDLPIIEFTCQHHVSGYVCRV